MSLHEACNQNRIVRAMRCGHSSRAMLPLGKTAPAERAMIRTAGHPDLGPVPLKPEDASKVQRRPDQRSDEAQQWRRLYRTRRWLDTRADQLHRHPLCAMCLPRVTAATVCDHADKDSKATEEGFFAGPFQSLCKTHHDATRQREERRGHGIGSDETGMPLDPKHPWNR